MALSIAGSDSGGCAGIAADLHTFAAHGVHGTVAITAVTAQDTMKVHGIVALDPAFVEAQIDAVMGDFTVLAAKTGMLATISIIEAVTARAARGQLPPLVVDPVMVASSGASLIEGDAAAAYRALIAHALVVTPNLAEAEVLLGGSIRGLAEMAEAARRLCDLGARVAVVKGGHLVGPLSVDVVCEGGTVAELAGVRIDTANVHGTGCTLSAAITANLARGVPPLEAVRAAKRYVASILASSAEWVLGSGPGPLDHLGRPERT